MDYSNQQSNLSSNNDTFESKSKSESEITSPALINESIETKKSEPTKDIYGFDNFKTPIGIKILIKNFIHI